MANLKTSIEWADATWSPVTGCTKVSTGCKFCYAERIMERWGQKFTEIKLHPERLDQPLRWKKPRRIFVNSMSDLFHEKIPADFIVKVFAVMESAHWHNFLILTKRADLMKSLLSDPHFPAYVRKYGYDWLGPKRYNERGPHWRNNQWLGVSVENQEQADKRIPLLLQTPAAFRFLSLEPLLGAVDWMKSICTCPWYEDARLSRHLLSCPLSFYGDKRGPGEWPIHWVIVGGESGGPPERRIVKKWWGKWEPKKEALQWVQSIRDQCVAAGVPFFFKQWGGPMPKSGGRLLDGRTWDEYPR